MLKRIMFLTAFVLWLAACAPVPTMTCTLCHVVEASPHARHAHVIPTSTPACTIPDELGTNLQMLTTQLVYQNNTLIGSVTSWRGGIVINDANGNEIAPYTLPEDALYTQAAWPTNFESLSSAKWVLCQGSVYFTWPDAPGFNNGG